MTASHVTRLLIANRGEIALRIARSARDLGLTPVAVASEDDQDSLHWLRSPARVALTGRGPRAYLDGTAIVAAAVAEDCQAIHPGYGFLAENARFAAQVEEAGLRFVGPTSAQLALFGDKLAARALAAAEGVPVLEASAAIADLAMLEAFEATLAGGTAILKASAGGGGRGMRILGDGVDRATALAACAGEALAAFGDSTVYAERFVARARHVEVQILGDGQSGVVHLWERDCSLQRRHQKLIEIAPAPHLPASQRDALLADACRMAKAVAYRGLATFEFLVDVAAGRHWFIEANPRLQVEHTVTEEILGLDLVALQLRIAEGATLAELGVATPPPPPSGFAIQIRINAETLAADGETRPAGGVLQVFEPASGAGIRVDAGVMAGYTLNPAFDSLLAKLIVRSASLNPMHALQRATAAVRDSRILGVDTSLGLAAAILSHPEVEAGQVHTRFVEAHAATLTATARALTAPALLPEFVQPAATTNARIEVPSGQHGVISPLRGSLVRYLVDRGSHVAQGTPVAVLEAMKMHHYIESSETGVVLHLACEEGETVAEGGLLCLLRPDAEALVAASDTRGIDPDAPRADLDEVLTLHAIGLDAARPAAVAKRRRLQQRTARENVAAVCDVDSFMEVGALQVAAQRRRRTLDDLRHNTPADGLVAGLGTVNAEAFGSDAARCAVLAYDYTVLAGTQGAMNHKKTDRLLELAHEWSLPVIFFTEGGGGRPGDVDVEDIIGSWLDLKTFATWPRLSGRAPRIAVNAGRCFAGNAVIFGCADITIATQDSNIGLAGPAMIEGGGLGRFTPEDIGPIEVQTANGVVDLAVADEVEGAALARRVLSCFQGRWPTWQAADQRVLRHVVPEDRLRVYDVRRLIETLADTGSVIELRPQYGIGIVTALIRIEGMAFGLIANDPRHLGGAIDGPAAEKAARFLQLCEAYGLPVVSLCDTPGFMVGPDSEKTAAVRRGSRLIIASANLSVPLLTVVTRKGYGLGAQAMAGGSFHRPLLSVAWPTGEFGPMGLEGAVNLGFRKELEAETDPVARKALFDTLLAKMYAQGKAVSVASFMEIDAVIDPADTRRWLLRALAAAGPVQRAPRRYVDVW